MKSDLFCEGLHLMNNPSEELIRHDFFLPLDLGAKIALQIANIADLNINPLKHFLFSKVILFFIGRNWQY